MNKNFQDAKEHFINEGYCSFDINEFDIEFANFLEEMLSCDSEINLQNCFKKGRFDSENYKTTLKKESFQKLDKVKSELVKEYDFYNGDVPNVTQCWFFTESNEVHEYLKKNKTNYYKSNLKNYLEKVLHKIMQYFYDLDASTNINFSELQFSLYNKDCVFTQHSDGIGVNYCSILIYLNKNYNESDGGLLLLNNESVIPELGKVAIMDLSKHDVRHGVSKVTGGYGRFAILCFPIIIQ